MASSSVHSPSKLRTLKANLLYRMENLVNDLFHEYETSLRQVEPEENIAAREEESVPSVATEADIPLPQQPQPQPYNQENAIGRQNYINAFQIGSASPRMLNRLSTSSTFQIAREMPLNRLRTVVRRPSTHSTLIVPLSTEPGPARVSRRQSRASGTANRKKRRSSGTANRRPSTAARPRMHCKFTPCDRWFFSEKNFLEHMAEHKLRLRIHHAQQQLNSSQVMSPLAATPIQSPRYESIPSAMSPPGSPRYGPAPVYSHVDN